MSTHRTTAAADRTATAAVSRSGTSTTTTGTTTTGTGPWPGRAGRALARRWPTALGAGLALLSVVDLEDGVELAAALALAAFGYLLVAVVGRPGITWPAVLALGAAVVGLRSAGVDAVAAFAAAAVALAVVAVATGRLGDGRSSGRPRWLQAPAAAVFGSLALAATLVSVEVGGLLVAAGLIAHAGWDLALRRARPTVVSRSFVEWCAAFDLVAGVGIIAVVAGG